MKILILIICLGMTSFFTAQKPNLIPYPQKIEFQKGIFSLNSKTTLVGDPKTFEYQILLAAIKKQHHLDLSKNTKNKGNNVIFLSSLNKEKQADQRLSANDSYYLNINAENVVIKGRNEAGLFQGIQTFLQLVNTSKDNKITALTITDFPKFDYRGMHLDVCRHFFTVSEVKKYLDYLAQYKYNKFHWHLTDDQGWRIEIKKYPKLTQIGAWRNGSQIGPYTDMTFDDKKYGGFYTQNEIKEVVAYAKERHIDIIPEIEMPGHSVAAIASYPKLSCQKGPFEVSKKWGVEENILCPKEETFKFLENVIDEVIALFPYEYIHIGGDEAPKKAWKESEIAQNLIKKHHLKDEHGLQSYFITRMENYINSKGKKIIGWNEILEGGLAPNATVMSWTGIEAGIEAAKTGHKAIMTPTSTNYFDYYQGNPETEPLAFGGDIRLEKVYRYQPIPAELSPEEAKFIWGTQGNLWTEYILDFKQVEHMIFPRMMALSEVAWGTSKPEDYKNFENRVIEHFNMLDQQNIAYSKAIFEVVGHVNDVKDGQIYYQLSSAKNPENIRYTLDGSEPNAQSETYKTPLLITKNITVKAAYFENGTKQSSVFSQNFHFSKTTGKPIVLAHLPAEAYAEGGAKTLVNAIRGEAKNFGKNFLGFNGKDCITTIDFGAKTNFSKLQFTSVDRKGSWIYLPKSAKIFGSDDGKSYKEIAKIDSQTIITSDGNASVEFPQQAARFVKIEIQNFGIIPDKMEGAGNGSWLFVDEIEIH